MMIQNALHKNIHQSTEPYKAIAQRLSERFTSVDSLLECLLPPLINSGLVIVPLQQADGLEDSMTKLMISDSCIPGSVRPSSFWSRELPRIQSILLTRIAVDWRTNLIESQHWQSVYYAWFGLPHQDLLLEPASRRVARRMACVAIESMVNSLSQRASPSLSLTQSGALHPVSIQTIREILGQILETYTLIDWHSIFYDDEENSNSKQQSRQDADWRSFVKTLLSIPDQMTSSSLTEASALKQSFQVLSFKGDHLSWTFVSRL